MDFAIDRLEDVRLAVDETASMLIKDAEPDSELECAFIPGDNGQLDLVLSAYQDWHPATHKLLFLDGAHCTRRRCTSGGRLTAAEYSSAGVGQ